MHRINIEYEWIKRAIARESSAYDFARLPKTDEHKKNLSISKQVRRYKLTSPVGTETIFDRCIDAAKFSGVAVSALIKLAGNRYKFDNCKGWKCKSISF